MNRAYVLRILGNANEGSCSQLCVLDNCEFRG